eukprot:657380_1
MSVNFVICVRSVIGPQYFILLSLKNQKSSIIMDTVETASRKVKQMGRQIESSMGNLKNMMSSISLVGDAKHFQEGKGKFEALRAKLENKQEKNKLDAMKTLIAMMTLGRDVSELFPSVVKNVVVESMEIKKLVYMYVIHYASMNPNLALLSISSFQKDMASPNPLVRAKALHAMSCMRVTSVTHLIILQLKNAVKDSSPYVRRTASQVLPSVHNLDGKFKTDLMTMLTTLLADDDVYVLSGALYAFNSLCPNRFDLLHTNYRKICHLLADMDENGQIVALSVLLRYCRNQFKSPFIADKPKDGDNNGDDTKKDEDAEESDEDDLLRLDETDDFIELDPDHKLLIASVKNLVYSMNSAVVLGVVTLLFYCAPKNETTDAIRALIQFVNFSKREIAYCVLANISTMASERPGLFSGFYKDFYIKSIEAGFIKELKLDILSKITTDSNINPILHEFEAYASDPDTSFRCSTIDAMGRCSSMIPDVAEKTMHSLMSLLSPSAQSPDVVAASVVVIRQIIQRSPDKYERSMLKLLTLLQKTNVPAARSAIVWIIGEYRQYISDYVPDALRILAKKFIHEANEVKLQILNLAVKVYLADPKKVMLLFKYILDLCKYDQNYDLRDRARLIRCIFFQKKKKKSTSTAIDPETQRKLRTKMQEMFLAEKRLPEIVSPFKERDRFVMNTLSHMMMHNVGEHYQNLEDFPEIPPDNTEKRTPADTGGSGLWNSNKDDSTKKGKSRQGEGFFDDEDSSDSVEEFTSSTDSGSSDSGSSDSESGSTSESESGSSSTDTDDDSSSSSGSDSESSSGTESESASEESIQIKTKKKETVKASKTSKTTKKKVSSDEEEVDDAPEEEEEEELESSSDLEVAEVFVSTPIVNTKEDKDRDKRAMGAIQKLIRKDDDEDDGTDGDDESESEEEIVNIKPKKTKKKHKKDKESSKEQPQISTAPEPGDLLGDLFGDMASTPVVVETQIESVNAPVVTTASNPTFDMFDLLATDTKKAKVESTHQIKEKEVKQSSSKDEDETSKKQSKKKSKKSKKKAVKESSSEDSELGSDDFASDSEPLAVQKEEEEIKMDPLEETQKKQKKQRADQLSDLFSSVMGDSAPPMNDDDILFGASPETLMKGVPSNTGFKGELLNHTHTQGLQIEYEFVRQPSRYGVRFNQIKLIFMNRWDKRMRGISLCPHNLDKSQQDYRDILEGGIAELQPGQKKTDYIHVQFGKTSEMRFNINVDEGTNKRRHTAKIKGIPGELMRPNVSYSVDEFMKKKGQTGAMNERKITCVTENIEEAANQVLKSFNVGIVNSGANKHKFDQNKERYFAGYLLADDSDVLIALETQSNNNIVCTIHCTEFMLIDAITGVARQCLTKK